MKSKFLKKKKEEKEVETPDLELEEDIESEDDEDEDEDDFDDIDIEEGGPSISSAKKNKLTLIAGFSLFIAVVLYVFFAGEDEKKKPKVVPVPPKIIKPSPGKINPEKFTPPRTIKEPFEEPTTPTAPAVPVLPVGVELPAIVEPVIPAIEIPSVESPAESTTIDKPFTEPGGNEVVTSVPTSQATAPNPRLDPRYAPIVVFSGGQETLTLNTVPGVGHDENIVNLKEDPIDSLEKSPVRVKTTLIEDRVHTINQGKLLTAVLETAINTEIPGAVRAIISRDVYGESGNKVLIPRGSRLYGAYSTKVVRGQGRVNISWTRLIRSDGIDLGISFNASDQFGRAGIPGQVDNKYGSIITNSLLTSVLAVGGVAAVQELIGDSADTASTTTAGVTTTTGNASAQAVADVTSTIIDTVETVIGNTLNLTPVITIPQGTKITVVVNADMNLPELIQ